MSERSEEENVNREETDAEQQSASQNTETVTTEEKDDDSSCRQEKAQEDPDQNIEEETEEDNAQDLAKEDGAAPDENGEPSKENGRAKGILEGLLFITGDDGLTAEQAASALDISKERVEALFDELTREYAEDDDRGIEIACYGGIYRFLSKEYVHDYAKKLFSLGKQATLSQAALETLAIIAYKGPVTRVEIEEIRGVGADMMLRKLLARDLIKESGRSDAPGRPILYEVTEEFMNSFKLMSLKELPELPKIGNDEESDDLFQQ